MKGVKKNEPIVDKSPLQEEDEFADNSSFDEGLFDGLSSVEPD